MEEHGRKNSKLNVILSSRPIGIPKTQNNGRGNPQTIYDMYGFPKELYEITYNTPGSPGVARLSKELISRETRYDNTWGIDHGAWSVLVHMYPDRDIPVSQISVDAFASPEEHYKIGRELRALRDKGVLIFGTGNIVHNLRLVDWHKASKGFDCA